MRSTAIEFVPDSDFSYCRLREMARNRALLMLYTHEQVEHNDMHQPMYTATLPQRDLLILARAALHAAGRKDLADLIPTETSETRYKMKVRNNASNSRELGIG